MQAFFHHCGLTECESEDEEAALLALLLSAVDEL
jgi:hypothetical protein